MPMIVADNAAGATRGSDANERTLLRQTWEKATIDSFSSAGDLMQKTPIFWEKFVQKKLDRDFGALYRFLNQPYPAGPNVYLERIQANMDRLKMRMATVAA